MWSHTSHYIELSRIDKFGVFIRVFKSSDGGILGTKNPCFIPDSKKYEPWGSYRIEEIIYDNDWLSIGKTAHSGVDHAVVFARINDDEAVSASFTKSPTPLKKFLAPGESEYTLQYSNQFLSNLVKKPMSEISKWSYRKTLLDVKILEGLSTGVISEHFHYQINSKIVLSKDGDLLKSSNIIDSITEKSIIPRIKGVGISYASGTLDLEGAVRSILSLPRVETAEVLPASKDDSSKLLKITLNEIKIEINID